MVEYGKRAAADAAGDEPPHKHFRSHGGGGPLDPEVQAKLDTIYADGLVAVGDLDERALELLSYLPANTALDVLEEFAHADMARVRNKSAFFSGICNRFKGHQRPPGRHEQPPPPDRFPHPPGGQRLHPDIQGRLDHLYKRGALQPGQLDARCLDALQTLPLRVCMRAIDRLVTRDLADIRNMSAFFMSAIKAALQEAPPDDAAHASPRYRPDRGPPLGGGYVPPPHDPLLLPPPPPPPRFQGGGGSGPRLPGLDNGGIVAGGVDLALLPTGMVPPAGPASSSAALSVAKRNYALDQTKLGVRTDEFHALSVFAVFVHPAPALKLQQLWDEGNPLVSLLDDGAWSTLAELGAPEGLAVIEETAAVLNPHNPQDNISSVLVAVAQRYLPRGTRPMVNAMTAGTAAAAPSSLAPFVSGEPDALSGYHEEPYGKPAYPSNGFRPPQHGRGGDDYHGDTRRRPSRPDVFRDRDRERQPGNLGVLPLALQQKIEEIIATQAHCVKHHHFDEGVVGSLLRLPQGIAISVLQELEANDLATVRNVPAYIMGICKRYQHPRTDVGYIPPQQRV